LSVCFENFFSILNSIIKIKDIYKFTIYNYIGYVGDFSAFLEVQTTLVADFYGVIHAMEEAQKMGLTNV